MLSKEEIRELFEDNLFEEQEIINDRPFGYTSLVHLGDEKIAFKYNKIVKNKDRIEKLFEIDEVKEFIEKNNARIRETGKPINNDLELDMLLALGIAIGKINVTENGIVSENEKLFQEGIMKNLINNNDNELENVVMTKSDIASLKTSKKGKKYLSLVNLLKKDEEFISGVLKVMDLGMKLEDEKVKLYDTFGLHVGYLNFLPNFKDDFNGESLSADFNLFEDINLKIEKDNNGVYTFYYSGINAKKLTIVADPNNDVFNLEFVDNDLEDDNDFKLSISENEFSVRYDSKQMSRGLLSGDKFTAYYEVDKLSNNISTIMMKKDGNFSVATTKEENKALNNTIYYDFVKTEKVKKDILASQCSSSLVGYTTEKLFTKLSGLEDYLKDNYPNFMDKVVNNEKSDNTYLDRVSNDIALMACNLPTDYSAVIKKY